MWERGQQDESLAVQFLLCRGGEGAALGGSDAPSRALLGLHVLRVPDEEARALDSAGAGIGTPGGLDEDELEWQGSSNFSLFLKGTNGQPSKQLWQGSGQSNGQSSGWANAQPSSQLRFEPGQPGSGRRPSASTKSSVTAVQRVPVSRGLLAHNAFGTELDALVEPPDETLADGGGRVETWVRSSYSHTRVQVLAGADGSTAEELARATGLRALPEQIIADALAYVTDDGLAMTAFARGRASALPLRTFAEAAARV
eukprot:CAMPEP_0179874574 /NCGR_PEP_ID=MMETSP0982-20121206/22947_1 /TAXON_ID=483367 /ORGANISM="non described non described, Strain CCMP 2436" /LENGTH=255 /DNA_ID=CAMNT_0021766351 /DNA_START=86 /DNA_END=850 /DNA_ORIENTATION=+